METSKEDLLEFSPLAFITHAAGVLKKGVNPAPSTLQVSADPWDFTVGEQVDADAFYGPMLPAQRRAAASMSLGIKGKRSFMSYWGYQGGRKGWSLFKTIKAWALLGPNSKEKI